MRGYTFTFEGRTYTWWRTIRLPRGLRFTFGFRLPFRTKRGKLICSFWKADGGRALAAEIIKPRSE